MNKALRSLVLIVFFALAAFAQNALLPDQFVGAGLHYSQQSSPNMSGLVAYAKLVDRDHGVYSYSLIRESSIFVPNTGKTLAQRVQAMQTSTETGAAVHMPVRFGAFDLFALGTGGLASTGPNTGIAGSGGVLATKGIGKGWYIGLSAWAAYADIPGAGISYPVGLVIGWGK